ncbi:MAG: hydrogenase maturation nickel metallochaperone HypA [Ignavibacteriaceae bacterium]|nr:hydrogenase maturation nickel metallochaperone HypA [Ignavibacteriaceae bacterium]
MHELSIAQNIIRIINSSVEKEKLGLADKIYLKVGRLSNILTESLLFCFNSAIENTPLQNSELAIEIVPIKIQCNDCNQISATDDFIFTCPSCNGSSITVIGGDELVISSIHLKDESEYIK